MAADEQSDGTAVAYFHAELGPNGDLWTIAWFSCLGAASRRRPSALDGDGQVMRTQIPQPHRQDISL
jgi:hypothetical protein